MIGPPLGAWVAAFVVAALVGWLARMRDQGRAWALAAGIAVGWSVMLGPAVVQAATARGWPVVVAVVLSLVPMRWVRWVGPLAALLALTLPLWLWWPRQGWMALVWVPLMGGSMVAAAQVHRVADWSTGVVLAVAALVAVPLVLLNGSARLAHETSMVACAAMGVLPWRVRRADAWVLAVAGGMAVWLAVHLSELGGAALVPGACVACAALAKAPVARASWMAIVSALFVAVAGTVPTVVDWVREPAF